MPNDSVEGTTLRKCFALPFRASQAERCMLEANTLYKYLPPERVDIIQNLKIRFTQVSALNDPFESLPGVIEKDRDWYWKKFSVRVEREIQQRQIKGESKKKQYKRARKKEFDNFHKCYTDRKWLLELSEEVQKMSDTVHGCLSLSRTPNNILM